MITRSTPLRQPPLWQQMLAEAVTDPVELLDMLDLPVALLPGAQRAAGQFRLRVPRAFIARMNRGDPHDPLLRQVLPLGEELVAREGYSPDPLDEHHAMPVPGLLHKYQGRILLTLTGACAIHCRYCFRRHYPYSDANPTREHWQNSLDYLQKHPEVSEVILSGGDPLTLSDDRLQSLVADLTSLARIKSLRIHSRLPVVLPQRVDENLLHWMTGTRLQLVVVIHCNHANEIDDTVASAIQALRSTGATLLNQSVLLRGVNDNAGTLIDLSQRLFETGVLPYYLHQLDPVQGAAHFMVDEKRATSLVDEMRAQLPGYLLPRLVREIPHRTSKTALF